MSDRGQPDRPDPPLPDRAGELEHPTKAWKQTAAIYKAIVESALDCIICMDADGRVVEFNLAAQKTFKYSRRQALGKDLAELIFPVSNCDSNRARMSRYVADKEGSMLGVHFQVVARRADGSQFPAEMAMIPAQVHELAVLTVYLRDVTERKEAEQNLRASEERFRTIFASSPDPIIVAAVSGKILRANTAACQLLDLHHDGLIGKSIPHLGPPSERETARQQFSQLAEGTTIESLWQAKSGRVVPVEIRSARVVHAREPALLLHVRDITERKRAEEERLRLERKVQQARKWESLGVLAGSIAHDFNSILVRILGNSATALEHLPTNSPAHDNVKEILDASRHAAELCRQMLAYSGRGKFVVQPVNLNDVVTEMARVIKGSLPQNISVQYDLADSIPLFEGDATQVRQIIRNLIANAAEAIGDNKGVIIVSTGALKCDRACLDEVSEVGRASLAEPLAEGTYVYLEVSDGGCGMDAKTRERMFEPFFTSKATGRGLGMAAVLGILRGHKGAIKVQSEVGQGSTLRVLFPAREVSVASPETHSQPAATALPSAPAVLVADDEEVVRSLAKQILERAGFGVVMAADGRQAVNLFRENAEQVVCALLDLNMPHLDGQETLRQLRRLRPGIKVILCSAYEEQEICGQFTDEMPDVFLQKPFQSAALVATLTDLLPR